MEANHVHRRYGKDCQSGFRRFTLSASSARKTLLYQLVLEHYPDFRRQLAEEGRVLPDYVQREFEDYLKCGRLEHGFIPGILPSTPACGDFVCPSCGTHRMAESSAFSISLHFSTTKISQSEILIEYF
jgi:hypothetical protein